MKRILISFVLVLSCITLSFTQSSHDKQIIPPSPNASAFSKYLDIPINTFTGSADISIPLYTLSIGDISLPVVLSYNPSLKVEEMSSWVGLGWSLSAGGSINRNINTLPDEDVNFGYFANAQYFTSSGTIDYSQLTCSNLDLTDMNLLTSGCMDISPDVYTFSVPGGIGGKFIFGVDKTLYQIPHQAIKIIHPYHPEYQGSWQVINTNGVQYFFKRAEMSHSISSCDVASFNDCYADREGITTWHIDKIVSASLEDTVYYHYDTEVTQYKTTSVSTRHHQIMGLGPDNPITGVSSTGEQSCIQDITVTGLRLNSITSTDGHLIEFIVDSQERLDLQGGHSLKEVKISYKGALIKHYAFNYSYFNSNNYYSNTFQTTVYGQSSNSDIYANKALRLDSLQEFASSGASLPPHIFEYEGDFRPSRHSKDKDFWGYFNNANNIHLTPYTTLDYTNENLEDITLDIKGGHRYPHLDYMQMGVLKQMTYPSGGSALLTYEAHEYDLPHTLYEFAKDSVLYHFDYNSNQAIKTQSFNLSSTRRLRIWSHSPSVDINGHSIQSNPYCYLILKKNGVIVADLTLPHDGTGKRLELDAGTYEIEGKMQNYDCTGQGLPCMNPPVTFWTGVVDPNVPESFTYNNQDYIDLKLLWEKTEDTTQVINSRIGGGLRIKSYELVGGEGTPNLKKHYSYEGGKHYASMVNRFIVLSNNFINGNLGTCQSPPNVNINYYMNLGLVAQSNGPMSAIQGSFVGYDKVTVSTDENAQLGKSEFYYKNIVQSRAEDIGLRSLPELNNYPYQPNTTFTYEYGKLLKQINYLYQSPQTFQKLDEIEYIYKQRVYKHPESNLLIDKQLVYGGKIAKVITSSCEVCNFPTDGSGSSNPYGEVYRVHQYSEASAWLTLDTTITRVYDKKNPSRYMESLTTYEYDPLSLQVKRQFQDLDGGHKQQLKYKYALDYALGTDVAIDTMQSRHMIALPIEQQTWRSKEELGQQIFKFQSGVLTKFQVLHQHILAQEIYSVDNDVLIDLANFTENTNGDGLYTSLIPNTHYQLQYQYLAYDDSGNLLSQAKTEDIPTSYLWAYDKTRPIAQLVGATYSEVEQAFGGTVPDFGANGFTGTQENDLRTWFASNKPEVQITTYTYDESRGGVVSTITSPNNQTVTYEYDDFNRLSHIKDFEGNIIKSYQYHYKGE